MAIRYVLMNDSNKYESDIDVTNGVMHYMVTGDGPALLLLHGALGTGYSHFRHQIEALSHDYKVIVPDFLGYGESGKRDIYDEHFYRRDADDIASLMVKLQLTKVNICGFSDGGIVGMNVAVHYGQLINSLVLIGAQPVWDEITIETIRTWGNVEQLSQGFQDALAKSHGDPYWKDLIKLYVQAAERVFANQELIAPDMSNIDCPTLVVHGDQDIWGGIESAYIVNDAIAGSKLKIFIGAGHYVQRDAPDEFNRSVMEFLDSVCHS